MSCRKHINLRLILKNSEMLLRKIEIYCLRGCHPAPIPFQYSCVLYWKILVFHVLGFKYTKYGMSQQQFSYLYQIFMYYVRLIDLYISLSCFGALF